MQSPGFRVVLIQGFIVQDQKQQNLQQHLSVNQESGQQGALHEAFVELQTRQLRMEQVRRVAVEREGTFHIEVHEAGKQRFFVFEANELIEIEAETDPKIPFASKLQEAGFSDDYSIISYRPKRRIVLETVDPQKGNIIKAYKKRIAALAAEKHAIALSACQSGGFDVPELLQVGVGDDYLCMVKRTGQAPDITTDAVSTWATIAACLRHFQEAPVSRALQVFDIAQELAVLDDRARRLRLCMPVLPRHWQEGRERLQELASILPPAVNGLAHRDLHDRQFIVSGKTITLLDFDLLCIADVALDAANLLAHMKLRTMQGNQGSGVSGLSDCSEVFLQALGRQDEAGFEQRLLFYQASTFFRLALLYALRPRWTHLTEPLIAEANNCINKFSDSRVSS
jgi:hypothetical protein